VLVRVEGADVRLASTPHRVVLARLALAAQADVFAAEVGEVTVRYAAPESWLLTAIWARRHNVNAYDAGCLALADMYDAPLVTLDERLAGAAGQAGISATVPTSEPAGQ
jgi:predicted nucleic acid-binding protein